MTHATPISGELPIVGLLKGPETVREDILRAFGDDEEAATNFAIRWAFDHRRIKPMSQSETAKNMGIASSHLCNILAGRKYLPPHKINAYEWIVGNRAVSQTIERFRVIRENEQARQLAAVIADQLTRAA